MIWNYRFVSYYHYKTPPLHIKTLFIIIVRNYNQEMNKVILLDNGHGDNTPGKRSPDWSLLEWKYTRQIVKKIYKKLIGFGYDARILVPEDHDVDLWTRCKRVNAIVEEYGRENVLLVSVHINAGPCEGWHKASGWQVHTCLNPSKESINMANVFFEEVQRLNYKTRRPSCDQNYWKSDFCILRKTNCPAILTENFFMTNEKDVEFLLSDVGRNAITEIHVNSIMKLIK